MKKFLTVFSIFIVLAMAMVMTGQAYAEGQAGTTLTADVTATSTWTMTYHWTIDKSVVPASWDLFTGDTGTSRYTITVTKDSGTEEGYISGQVCVTNGGGVATENLTIKLDIKNGYPPPNDIIVTDFLVSVASNPVLDPGETGCYDYKVTIPYSASPLQPHPGGLYKVTANVTITNHSGSLGIPFGPSPSADTTFPLTPVVVNGSINVDDTNGGSWLFNAGGSVSYDVKFACDADEGKHDNTATIRETGQSDDASVTVNCYELEVTKDATTTYKRTYKWTIDKSADQSSLTLALNQSFLVNYKIDLGATYDDSDWAVAGNIYVKNPAPIPATLNSVSDIISTAIAADVDCGVTFPYILAADTTLTCTYSSDLPDASTRLNTATATLQNYDYDYLLAATADGTTDFSGNADVIFGSPTTSIDECIEVSDTYAGSLGTVCFTDLPKSFLYSRLVGPYEVCGTYKVDNTAAFVTNDTQTPGEDSWTVDVNVPCAGCTLTIGYWKTHAGFGPQADMVTRWLPIWLGKAPIAPAVNKSQFVTTNTLAVQFLSFMGSNNVFSASNGINKLYAQLLAAKLNIANGADPSAVAATIISADNKLSWKNSLTWSTLTKLEKDKILALMTILNNFNNGYIGPGHCDQ